MTNDELTSLLEGRELGDERDRFMAHFDRCPDCRTVLAESAQHLEAVRDSAESSSWVRRGTAVSPILAYYWLTPVFWVVDEYLGANLRTAALEGHPWWKAGYYVFCIGIGVIVTMSPDWTAHLGLLEAQINIALLVAGILVPY